MVSKQSLEKVDLVKFTLALCKVVNKLL